MRKGLFIILILLSLNVYSQSSENYFISSTEYGTEDQIGFPSDVEFHNDKLYVLDYHMLSIWVFNLDGSLDKQLEFTKGKGPGEFSMGIYIFTVINDSLIALFDDFKMQVFFVDVNGKYQYGFRIQDQINNMFWKDGLLHLVSVGDENLIKQFDLTGKFISSYMPSPERKKNNIPGIPKVCFDGKTAFFTNPYADEIFCWKDEIKWKFKSKVPLVQVTKYGTRKYMRLKSWRGIEVYKDYVMAATYDKYKNNSQESLNGPQLLFINKKNGELIERVKCEETQFLYSFDDLLFKYYTEPYPHIKQVEINELLLKN